MSAPDPFARGSSYPVRTTAKVDFFVDAEEAFGAIADAIESARRYVYMTCAFASLNFRLRPPSQEQLLDLVNRVSRDRGIRVAILFWQPVTATGEPDVRMSGVVPNTASAQIATAAPKVMARWDVAKTAGIYPQMLGCHHQKTFVIDGTVAFVGGINMTQDYWDTAAHQFYDDRRISYDLGDADRKQRTHDALPLHDVFCGFTGPAVVDVEANFVERWNGATFRSGDDLTLSTGVVADPGASTRIQIARTIAPHTYPHTASGEQSIKEAYLNLLNEAQQHVYFENQYFFDDDVVAAIRGAAERGVRIVGLLTRAPDAGQFVGCVERLLEDREESILQWTRFNPILSRQIQLYSPYIWDGAKYKDIYVHSKTMIVDDRYVVAGSANISFTSLDFHSEMCAIIDDATRASVLRRRLWSEHLCQAPETLPSDFVAGADLWVQHGADNEQRLGKDALRSRVVPLRPVAVVATVPAILDGGSNDSLT